MNDHERRRARIHKLGHDLHRPLCSIAMLAEHLWSVRDRLEPNDIEALRAIRQTADTASKRVLAFVEEELAELPDAP